MKNILYLIKRNKQIKHSQRILKKIYQIIQY